MPNSRLPPINQMQFSMPSSFFDNYAIVFAGGGARGAWQLGVWKAFQEQNLPPPQAISGTSVGALNATMFAQQDYQRAEHIWKSIDTLKIIEGTERAHHDLIALLAGGIEKISLGITPKIWNGLKLFYAGIGMLGKKWHQLSSKGVFASDGLQTLIDHGVEWDSEHFRIPVYICAHNKLLSKVEYFDLRGDCRYTWEERKKLLLSSASIPWIFPEVKVRENAYCDGGYAFKKELGKLVFYTPAITQLDNAPITPILQHHPDIRNFIIIGLEPKEMTYRDDAFATKVNIFPLFPRQKLGFPLNFSHEHTTQLIQLGYDEGRRWLQRLHENADQCKMAISQLKDLEQQFNTQDIQEEFQSLQELCNDFYQEELRQLQQLNPDNSASIQKYVEWCQAAPISLEQSKIFQIGWENLRWQAGASQSAIAHVKDFQEKLNRLEADRKALELSPKNSVEHQRLHQAEADISLFIPQLYNDLLQIQGRQAAASQQLLQSVTQIQLGQFQQSIMNLRMQGQMRLAAASKLPSSHMPAALPPKVAPLFQPGGLDSVENLESAVHENQQENLVFFSTEFLCSKGLEADEETRAAVVAELLLRQHWSGNRKLTIVIDQQLPNGERAAFTAMMPSGNHMLTSELLSQYDFWQPGDHALSRKCLSQLRQRLGILLKADGLLPIQLQTVSGNGPSSIRWLPFHLENATITSSGVRDLSGQETLPASGQPDWSARLRELRLPVQVSLHAWGLSGASIDLSNATLAIQLAWWRKCEGNDGLPRFSPFALAAVGDWNATRGLLPCALPDLMHAFLEQFPTATLVHPDTGAALPKELADLPLPLCLSKEQIRESLREHLDAHINWDQKYALLRQQALTQAARTWDIAKLPQLQHILQQADVLGMHEYPQEYLTNLMLRSQAACHLGDTATAQQLNAKALAFAQSHGEKLEPFLYRLRIEQLIQYQDDEDFDLIVSGNEGLEAKLQALNDDDLLMRYHGTIAQAHAYGTLARHRAFTQRKAKHHFEQAIQHAIRLKSHHDIAQDLNYQYLYYALFQPGSQEAKEAKMEAENKIQALRLQDAPYYLSNYKFLLRYQALEWYRSFLKTGTVPDCIKPPQLEGMLQQARSGDWLAATIEKYFGALDAAAGQTHAAERRLSHALELLSKSTTSPVLQTIRLTILAEAFHSLQDKKYLLQGKELVEQLASHNRVSLILPPWQKYLADPEGTPFPAWNYWY